MSVPTLADETAVIHGPSGFLHDERYGEPRLGCSAASAADRPLLLSPSAALTVEIEHAFVRHDQGSIVLGGYALDLLVHRAIHGAPAAQHAVRDEPLVRDHNRHTLPNFLLAHTFLRLELELVETVQAHVRREDPARVHDEMHLLRDVARRGALRERTGRQHGGVEASRDGNDADLKTQIGHCVRPRRSSSTGWALPYCMRLAWLAASCALTRKRQRRMSAAVRRLCSLRSSTTAQVSMTIENPAELKVISMEKLATSRCALRILTCSPPSLSTS